MKSEVVFITPLLAKKYLSNNTDNRLISDRRVGEYVADIVNNNWRVTHQGIAFYKDGTLADGQHRLLAIVRANKGAKMMVTTGIERAAAIGIDRNRSRSVQDIIRIGKLSDWIGKKEISMINLIAEPKRLSTTEIVKWAEKMADSVKFTSEQFKSNRHCITNASIMAAVALAHYHGANRDDLMHFCKVFYNGITESRRDDIIIKLRDEFLKNTSGSGVVKKMKLLKSQRALDIFLNKLPAKRLFTPDAPIWTFNGDEE